MKKLIACFLLCLFVPSINAAISIGKTGVGEQPGGSAVEVPWTGGGNSTAGSTIMVYIFNSNQFARTFTVTDTAGNSYVSSTTFVHPNGGGQIIAYQCPNTVAAGTVTVTATGYEAFNVSIIEASGMATSSVLDKTTTPYNNGYDGPATWQSNATGTLSQAEELIVVLNHDYNEVVSAYAGTGYTQQTILNGDAILTMIVSATDSVTPSGTLTKANVCYVGTSVMTYKGANSGGSPGGSGGRGCVMILE